MILDSHQKKIEQKTTLINHTRMSNHHDLVRNATMIGSGVLLGAMLTKGIMMMTTTTTTETRKKQSSNPTTDDLSPPNSTCPSTGISFDSKLSDSLQASHWIFVGTHWMDLDYYNKIMVEDSKHHKFVAYPVRLRKEAGFMRAWGLGGGEVGDQTVVAISPCGDGDDSDRAHDMVGILIPFSNDEVQVSDGGKHIKILAWRKPFVKYLTLTPVEFSKLDWLSAHEPPTYIHYVYVNHAEKPEEKPRLPLSYWTPPNFDKPILQSFVDLIVEGALHYGEDFAKEFLDQIQWWCNEDGSSFYLNDREQARRPWLHKPIVSIVDRLLENHPGGINVIAKRKYESIYGWYLSKEDEGDNSVSKPLERPVPPPIVQRNQSKNFLFGFGSIINTKSRLGSDPKSRNAFACRIKAEFGYVREWNFQASTSKICALGLRKTLPKEKGATINGVLFSAPDDMTAFDQRENGYMRVRVPLDYVEILTRWNPLPKDASVYIYVPYAPKVVAKYGKDPATGLPRCSGPIPPKNLEKSEEAGLGLLPPSVDYPILQTYIDICILGCLEYGEAFAAEFIQTTFLWSRYWLNERELGRRPWLHQSRYVEIDNLLRQHLPQYFGCRKLSSEYALNLR